MSPRILRRFLAAVFVLFGAACSPPPHVLLEIRDPSGAAAAADRLQVERLERGVERTVAQAPLQFPLRVPFTSNVEGEVPLRFDALGSDGTVMARAMVSPRFARDGTPTATAELTYICETDIDCPADNFCAGAPSCVEGLCEYAGPPCVSDFPCVISSCNEESRSCQITVDHLLCGSDEYCDPGSGCTQGPPCMPENRNADCQDGNVCNGEEQCINFHCVAGIPPSVDDADVCTLDGCDDRRQNDGLDPIFHFPLNTLNGSECDLDTGRGVCVSDAGGCSASRCGDGVIDVGAGEVCDDGPFNSDAWTLEQHCNADCSGFGPFCGDGTRDDGFETCDDGARFDSGNGCSDSCQRNDGGCGDGVVQALFEECDDGQNGDPCDGCLDSCFVGCVCATDAGCDGAGEFCELGECTACDSVDRCGPGCIACTGETPLCGGPDVGCLCESDGSPRGSCFAGSRCAAGTCVGCDDALTCGPECESCSSPAPLCGGVETGCVVEPAGDCAGAPSGTRCSVTTTPDRAYDVCWQESCISPGCESADCNVSERTFALTPSGQRDCYDAMGVLGSCPGMPGSPSCATTPFCGQDAQYDTADASAQYERREPAPGEPVVVSSTTDLMWQGCVAGRRGSDCDPADPPIGARWDEAILYCEDLEWGGYRDWRLPNRFELQSIQDYGTAAPSLNSTLFPNTPSDLHWTISFAAGTTDQAWRGYFAEGSVTDQSIEIPYVVRCVRAGPTAVTGSRYAVSDSSVSGERIVNDALTGLVWQQCSSGLSGDDCQGVRTPFGWEGALAFCEGSSWGGFSDWRVPTIVELSTLVDASRADPAFDDAVFPGVPALLHWASTSYALLPESAWAVDVRLGDEVPSNKAANTNQVLCVRRP